MKLQTQIDRLIAEIERQSALLDEVVTASDRFSVDLPYPRLFKKLLEQHSFGPFELGGVRIYSNIKGQADNLSELLADLALTHALVEAWFLPFGRLATGSYDRVCFDVRGSKCLIDAPVVLMDHESILSHGRIGKPKILAKGFWHLLL